MNSNTSLLKQPFYKIEQDHFMILADQFEAAWELRLDDLETSLSRAEEAHRRANTSHLVPEAIQFCDGCYQLILANYHGAKGDLLAGLSAALACYPVFQTDGSFNWLSRVHNLLGNFYLQLGNRSLALEHWLAYAKMAEEIGSELEIARAYHNVGWIPYQAEDYDSASSYFARSLPTIRQANNPHHVALNLCNLATCRIHQNRLTEADQLLQEALAVCSVHQLVIEHNVALQRMALLAEKQTALQDALAYYQHALAITDQHPDPFSRIPNLQAIGRLYIQLKQPHLAKTYLLQALQDSQDSGRKHFVSESHQLLAQLYQTTGDLEDAIDHLHLYDRVRSEVFDEVTERNVHNLRIMHQTELVRKEAQILKSQNEQLEQKVAERTSELTERTDELTELLAELDRVSHMLMKALKREEELNDLRTRIIDTVSHEFRTPLTVIKTSFGLIKRFVDTSPGDDVSRYFARIDSAIQYIVDLLTDVALVNHTTEGESIQAQPTEHRFGLLCQKITAKIISETNESHDFIFDYDATHQQLICVDTALLLQIVQNLLSNAKKYGGAAAPIRIHFTAESEWFIITVCDHGMGIPADEIKAIFDLFYRASNVQTERGLGLGLFIVRNLAQMMGGSVTATSPGLGLGSTFKVALPVR